MKKKHSGVIYDTSLEITLNNMEINIGFFNIRERNTGDIIWNGLPVEKMGGNKLKINEKVYDITSGIQKVLSDASNLPMKKLNDQDKQIFIIFFENLDSENRKAIRDEPKSGRYRQSKTNFKKHNLKGQGIEKIIIPSNITDIYTRLEVLLGLKLSGHTDTLAEASNLFDELFERGEIKNKQQYRKALDKFSTI